MIMLEEPCPFEFIIRLPRHDLLFTFDIASLISSCFLASDWSRKILDICRQNTVEIELKFGR